MQKIPHMAGSPSMRQVNGTRRLGAGLAVARTSPTYLGAREEVVLLAVSPPAIAFRLSGPHDLRARDEITKAGFDAVSLHGFEGPGWLMQEHWSDPSLSGLSAHLLAVGTKP